MIFELDEPPLPRRGTNGGGVVPLLPLNCGLLSGDGSIGGEVASSLLEGTAEIAGVGSMPLPLTAAAKAFTGGPTVFASCISDNTFTFPEIASTCAANRA